MRDLNQHRPSRRRFEKRKAKTRPNNTSGLRQTHLGEGQVSTCHPPQILLLLLCNYWLRVWMEGPIRQAAICCWRWTGFSGTRGAVGGREALKRTASTRSILTRSKATLATASSHWRAGGTRPLMRGVPLPGPTRSSITTRYVAYCLWFFFLRFPSGLHASCSSWCNQGQCWLACSVLLDGGQHASAIVQVPER